MKGYIKRVGIQRYIKMFRVFVGKTSKVVVFHMEGKKYVWGWLRLAWGAPNKVYCVGTSPGKVFEWGLRGADLRESVRQGGT